MWESLNLKFSKYPARMAVAQKMFELGLRISEDGKIYCGKHCKKLEFRRY